MLAKPKPSLYVPQWPQVTGTIVMVVGTSNVFWVFLYFIRGIIMKKSPERAGLVFEQGHNLCCFIQTLQDCKEVIYFALAREECKDNDK